MMVWVGTLRARGVTVKLRHGGRYEQFVTLTRRATLGEPTDETQALWHAARGLLDAYVAGSAFRPLRLLGVSLSQFVGADAVPPALFADEASQKRRRLDAALDDIARRIGRHALTRAAARPRRRLQVPE